MATPYHKNPRTISDGEISALEQSLTDLGDLSGIVHDLNSDEIIGGNQRSRVFDFDDCEIEIVQNSDEPDSQGTVAHGFVIWQNKRYAYRQVRWTAAQCEEANIKANKLGGDWDFEVLAEQFDRDDLLDWGFTVEELGEESAGDIDTGVEAGAKPNPRQLPIDVIYTLQMADCTCCLAVQAGLSYGIQSAHYRLCPYVGQLSGRHAVAFIDNDYFKYDHETHLAAVQQHNPKYATVRDAMTPEQCEADGIEHFDLAQILDWAEELSDYTENVIVIPKYDCIDQIPEKYMLGYSVPTSHGGTPLHVDAFRGRRVHLLGGSWKAQLAHMAALGDDVISLDNNYIARVASDFGGTIDPDGNSFEAPAFVNNIRYVALAIAFGAIGCKVNELFAAGASPKNKEV